MWPQYYYSILIFIGFLLMFIGLITNMVIISTSKDKFIVDKAAKNILVNIFYIAWNSFNILALHVGGFFSVWGW